MNYGLHGLVAASLMLSLATAQTTYAPRDVLICPVTGQGPALRTYLLSAGLEVAEADAVSGVLRVRVPVGEEKAWIARLGARRDVDYAERNGIGGGGLAPDDTYFGNQWHLRNTGQSGGATGADVRAVDAWDVTTGSNTTVIAVLDTGIDTDHPEFAGRIDPNGYDFVNQDPLPEADHPHGSQVSGVMCANADNAFGVAGIDWQCKVLPIKVLDHNNAGTTFDLAQGLNYCASQPQVQVISMSLINYPGNSTLSNALQVAANAGKILISCAGNGGIGNANTSWPGASPLTISIGATTRHDSRASFSATGSALDFVAPGESIVTVRHGASTNSWTAVSGCSFATPLTSGIIGLLLARADQLGAVQLTQQDVYDLLVLGAVDQVGPANEDPPGRDDYFGHGRLDARAAIDAVSLLVGCSTGTVGNGAGGPYEVLFVDGLAQQGSGRRITVAAGVPFPISMAVPASNPQPSATPPFAIFWAVLGDQGSFTPWQMPLGIGELCFDPGPLAFAQVAGIAPFTVTVPQLQPGFVASVQGAIFDSPQGSIGITNLVTWDVQTAPAPAITSVSPAAPAPGGSVRILGSGFLPGLVLRVEGIVTATTSVSATEVTFHAPQTVTCDTSLSITNPDNQSVTAPFNPSPTVTSVLTPSGTPAAGGTPLFLIGTNFASGTTVTIGGSQLTISSMSSHFISGTLPPGQVGPATITVTTPHGCTAVATLTYT